jgi:16S rRNA processing protein RimM
VRGELSCNLSCDGPDFFRQFAVLYWDTAGKQPVTVRSARPHKGRILLRLEGIDTVEAANALRGRTLYFRRSDAHLAEGAYFLTDLLGCEVRDAVSGEVYGTLTDVTQAGNANQVWRIRRSEPLHGAAEFLMPAVREFIGEMHPEEGYVTIRPIPGLLEGGLEV